MPLDHLLRELHNIDIAKCFNQLKQKKEDNVQRNDIQSWSCRLLSHDGEVLNPASKVFECIFRIVLNEFRPCFQIVAERKRSIKEAFPSHLCYPRVSNETTEDLGQEKNDPENESDYKQVAVSVSNDGFKCIEMIDLTEEGLDKLQKDEVSQAVYSYVRNLPAQTTKYLQDIRDSGHTPWLVKLHFNDDIAVTNLACNQPTWADDIRSQVFDRKCLSFIIPGPIEKVCLLQPVETLASILMEEMSGPSKFHKAIEPNKYDRHCIDFAPVPQDEIGFQATDCFVTKQEYLTALYLATYLDNHDAIRRITLYEATSKIIRLLQIPGQSTIDKVYSGFLQSPTEDECRLKIGDSIDVNFNPKEATLDRNTLPWSATVVDPSPLRPPHAISILVKRARFEGKDGSSPTWCDYQPHVVPSDVHSERWNLKKTIEEDVGNVCNVRIVTSGRTQDTIQNSFDALEFESEEKPHTKYNKRMLPLLIGKRPDLLPRVDLYHAIRDNDLDPMGVIHDRQSLNSVQDSIIDRADNLLGGLLIIQGPPGTGKTHMLLQLMKPFLKSPKKSCVLVATPSNRGADDIARSLHKYLDSQKEALKNSGCADIITSRYIIRLHSRASENSICDTQGPRSRQETPNTHLSPFTKTDVLESTLSGFSDIQRYLRRQAYHELEFTKFAGVKDKRVTEVDYSTGVMMLYISGVRPDNPFIDPDKTKYQCFRHYYEKSVSNDTLSAKELERFGVEQEKLFVQVLRNASAIVSTTAGVASEYLLQHVLDRASAIFVDEAAHEREDSLMPLFAARFEQNPCLVLIGDQKQLSPLVLSDTKTNAFAPQLQRSLMARMINIGHDYTMLTEQYRMVEDIVSLANDLVYEGQLISHESTEVQRRPFARAFRAWTQEIAGLDTNALWYDVCDSAKHNETVTDNTGSKSNKLYVCVTAKIVGVLLRKSSSGRQPTVAVLSPYLAQKNLHAAAKSMILEKGVPNIENLLVDTLDASQGRQFDFVIIDLPVTDTIGFLSDIARLNVAMTRARDGLVIVGTQSHILKLKARGQKRHAQKLCAKFGES